MPCTNLSAAGTVQPSTFVSIAADNQVAQSVLGDVPFGICGPGQKFAPIDYGNGFTAPTEAADAGDPLLVFTLGEMCELVLGVGGCSAGQFLKPDGAGQGIVAGNTVNDAYGALAIEAGIAGQKVRVMVVIGRGV